MPFTKQSAKILGSKGGSNRWQSKDPATNRTKRFVLALSELEYAELDAKAKKLRLSKGELVLRAMKAYEG